MNVNFKTKCDVCKLIFPKLDIRVDCPCFSSDVSSAEIIKKFEKIIEDNKVKNDESKKK
jgi:hypothetical protein